MKEFPQIKVSTFNLLLDVYSLAYTTLYNTSTLPTFQYNPYRDRLIKVFSSYNDEHFSFEDFLDLVSVMSENCPLNVKAAWAFRVFDFNEDNQITKSDIFDMLDRLTKFTHLENEAKDHITDVVCLSLIKFSFKLFKTFKI